ncbi:hypothetical protein, partial [Acinetobacter baumannii]|uniref:hypothetical protein n=1 Tax=Acinetobacter baumannii TaxID=470 RepID=UPI000D50C243
GLPQLRIFIKKKGSLMLPTFNQNSKMNKITNQTTEVNRNKNGNKSIRKLVIISITISII